MAKNLPKLEDLKETAAELALNPNYLKAMGWFQSAWAAIEINTDYAICRFLNVTHEQAHLITSGQMFGRKSRLLADLIARSDHPKKQQILRAFNKVRGGNLRDVFAHGYIASDKDTVTFIERPPGGDFRANQHVFTLIEFEIHVAKIVQAGSEFCDVLEDALEMHDHELDDFANSALSLNSKP